MSFQAMVRVWDLDLPHPEQIVLLALGQHADAVGNDIYPSVAFVAWKTGYSARQVQRIQKRLTDLKILHIVREPEGRPTIYRMDLAAGPLKTPYNRYRSTPDIAMSPPPDTAMSPRSNGTPDTTMSPPVPITHDIAMSPPPDVTPDIAVSPTPDISARQMCENVIPTPDIALSPKYSVKDPLTPPPPYAREYDDQDGGGGGGETMEYDVGNDVGNDGENVETSPLESQADEADVENVQRDLVDGLCALGVRPEMAKKAVKDKTVKTDYDVNLCKRFIKSSTADVPAAVLWSQYLSIGSVPPPPVSDTSTVTQDQIAAARRMMQESERRAEIPAQTVGLGGLAQALSGPVLRSIAPSITMPPGERARVLPFPGNPRP